MKEENYTLKGKISSSEREVAAEETMEEDHRGGDGRHKPVASRHLERACNTEDSLETA